MDSTILVVDDDQENRCVLQLALEFEGYVVACAANGEEALKQLQTISKPCVILLDLMMPVMNGWEFAEIIEKRPEFNKIPIVVTSALPEDAKKIPSLFSVLKKPINLDQLIHTVSQLCKPLEK